VRKIKLLIVTDEMEVGGTQRQITYMLKHINKQLFSVTLVYFRNRSFLVDELIDEGVEVVEIEKTRPLDVLFLLNFYKFVREGAFDIVHCFSFSGELWGAVVTSITKKETFISSIRGVYEWYSPLQWRIKKWVSSRSLYVIANSHAGARYATRMTGLPDNNMKVVYNGIPMLEFESKYNARVALSLPHDKRTGLFVGRLVDHKNVSSLVEALNILADRGRDFRFYIVGGGPEQVALEKMLTPNALNSVKFLGEMADVKCILSASDFVVLPSLREGLSNTILEAMLAAKPVIASDVGGNPELVENGVTGYLYKSGDVNKLAELIDRMLSADDSMLEHFGGRGRAIALDEFSIDAMVNKMELLYRSCIDNGLLMERLK